MTEAPRGNGLLDLEGMSIDELLEAKLVIDGDIMSIKDQIACAKGQRVQGEGYADPDWWRRAHSALRFKGRQSQQIQTAIRAERERGKREDERLFERRFVDAARELLPRTTFLQLCEVAKVPTP